MNTQPEPTGLRSADWKREFNWSNKLAPYSEEYRCTDDCKQSGCPGHTATFEIYHATDTYSIKFHDQEIHLDNAQLTLILDFVERMSGRLQQVHDSAYRQGREDGWQEGYDVAFKQFNK